MTRPPAGDRAMRAKTLSDTDRRQRAEIARRRRQYVEWIVSHFSSLDLSDADGRAWSLNHARLVLGRDLDEANRYFATARLTRDRDFAGIRLLRTLLDFRDSPRLAGPARQHLLGIFLNWQMDEAYRVAHWPARHTENHDLMFMTIGLFSDLLRGLDISGLTREIARSLAWRFERGWIEWNSPRYQMHYLNPLLVLADHAPTRALREGARRLVNVQLAERALLSVGGYLGGPFVRGWDRHMLYDEHGRPVQRGPCAYFDDNRYDAYLPNMWLMFGLAEPYFDYSRAHGLEPAGEGYGCGGDARLNQDEGMFMACSQFVPHPAVQALAREALTRPELAYRGTRPNGFPPDPLWEGHGPHPVCYYNTPHISMGSVQWMGWSHQTRYCNVMFAADPSKNLRIELVLPRVKWDRWRHERRGELAQHENWLVGRGELVEDGGIAARRVGPWRLYRVGKGLAAHVELRGGYHVIQVSDLDKYPAEQAFIHSLAVPKQDGRFIRGRTTAGDEVSVDTTSMAVWVKGRERESWCDMLHQSEPMRSKYGSGVIELVTDAGTAIIDHEPLVRIAESDGPGGPT